MYRSHVLVCGGTGCTSSNSLKIIERFEELIEKNGLGEEVKVVRTGCFGLCERGPIVIVYPEGAFYARIKPEDVDVIVSEHLIKGRIVQNLIYHEAKDGQVHHTSLGDIEFYKKQKRIALRNCGVIDPEKIDEYIAFDGYKALGKCLTELSREEVIDIVKRSGLRGRGGAGFSTGTKWEFAYKSQADKKYVACNGDEGDPGAFMDRSVLEGDPHAVLEAMAIAGYAIGSDQGYIYVRAEYPIAVKRLQIAIDQAREYGLLGQNIFGTDFNFDIEIRLREIVYDIGGGIPGGKRFKAAQTGGPSGGCIPASHLDTPIDYDSLIAIGSMMGSGGLIVMDEDNCMVDIAKFFLEFTVDESCGKCTPCRVGTRRMLEILERITNGEGRDGDIEKLEELAYNIKSTALCGLGQTAPNPVLSTLRYFRDEYEAHIYEKRCPAGHCKKLARIQINPEKCKGCSLCAKVCPVGAISGTIKQPFVIDQDKCIKCGACMEKCRFGAIEKK